MGHWPDAYFSLTYTSLLRISWKFVWRVWVTVMKLKKAWQKKQNNKKQSLERICTHLFAFCVCHIIRFFVCCRNLRDWPFWRWFWLPVILWYRASWSGFHSLFLVENTSQRLLHWIQSHQKTEWIIGAGSLLSKAHCYNSIGQQKKVDSISPFFTMTSTIIAAVFVDNLSLGTDHYFSSLGWAICYYLTFKVVHEIFSWQ